jgi:hypothetical protein
MGSLGFPVLAIVLFVVLLRLLYRERSEMRRLAVEKDLPSEHRLPRHYRSFTELEKRLWLATEELRGSRPWESARLRLRSPEAKVVREYVDGLHEDFERGNRIFTAVIRHSPDMKILGQLERQRLRAQLSFRVWYWFVAFRLKVDAISIHELRQLTDIVATLAYEVRTMLRVFEEAGNEEFVRSIVKNA